MKTNIKHAALALLLLAGSSNAQDIEKNESFISQVKITDDTIEKNIASKTYKSLGNVLVEKIASIGENTKILGINIKNEISNVINHAAAIAPNMYILGKHVRDGDYEKPESDRYYSRGDWIPNNPEAILITALSPIVTHVGLQKVVLPLIEDCIDLCIKNKNVAERLKQRFRDTTNFCGTRIILSLLLYKYVLFYVNDLKVPAE